MFSAVQTRCVRSVSRPCQAGLHRLVTSVAGVMLVCGYLGSAQATDLVSGIDMGGADSAVRPQDDLYLAVNGGWRKATPMPADESSIGVTRDVIDRTQEQCRELVEGLEAEAAGEPQLVRAMYRSFMDAGRIEELGLQPLAGQLGEVDAMADQAALTRLLGRWQQLGIPLPVAFSVDVDSKAPSHHLARIDQSGLAMPDRDYYLQNDLRFGEARKAYLVYLTASFEALGLSQPSLRARRVMALETAIARIQWDKVANRDPVRTYNRYSRRELAQKLPGFAWNGFLDAAGAGGVKAVGVSQPGYVKALGTLIGRTQIATWQDYLRIRLLNVYAPYLDEKSAARQFAFFGTVLNGMPENRPRWKRGLRLIDASIGEALGKLYVGKYFPPANKDRVLEMVHNIVQTYDGDLETLPWLQNATSRAEAHEKLARLTIKIGYPDKWKGYAGLMLDEKDLVGNVRRATTYAYRRQLAEIDEPVDRTRWGMTPQTVNAYYDPTMNEIVFPAAILQPPFFDMRADDAVNYGATGAVIGHEISHGFDDQGSQYDAEGRLRAWLDKADRQRFGRITSRLVAQYSHAEALPGRFVNGRLTLGENIADVAGLAIGFKAYELSLGGKPSTVMDGFTGEQRYFIGYALSWRSKDRPESLLAQITADPHAPDDIRVNLPASNSDAFQEAFGVKPGDRMYMAPGDRIRIW